MKKKKYKGEIRSIEVQYDQQITSQIESDCVQSAKGLIYREFQPTLVEFKQFFSNELSERLK